jgi:hypothetical protein
LVVHSTRFLKVARQLVKPEHFNEKESWVICTLSYTFFDQYGQAPKEYLLNEVNKHVRRASMREDEIELLVVLADSLHPDTSGEDYVLDEIVRFAKHEELRRAIESFMPFYNQGNYDIGVLMGEFERIQAYGRSLLVPGTDYFATLQERIKRRLDRRRARDISTLIPMLDAKFLGIHRPQLGTVMAPSGIGKSFCLTHFGKAALLQGLVVYHFSSEMSVNEVVDRYDQMVAGAPEDDLNQSGVIKALIQAMGRLQTRGGRLFVDYLEEGSTVNDLRNRIATISESTGTVPSLVIMDYGELLGSGAPRGSNFNLYTEQGLIWRKLKALAMELDVPIWTATQASREAVGIRRVTELQVSDSYEKVRISDIFIGFNRNLVYDPKKKEWKEIEEGEDENVVRLFMIKHRGRPDKYEVKFVANFDRGQFFAKRETDLYYARKWGETNPKETI